MVRGGAWCSSVLGTLRRSCACGEGEIAMQPPPDGTSATPRTAPVCPLSVATHLLSSPSAADHTRTTLSTWVAKGCDNRRLGTRAHDGPRSQFLRGSPKPPRGVSREQPRVDGDGVLLLHVLLRGRGEEHASAHVHQGDRLSIDDVIASAARVASTNVDAEETARLVVWRVLELACDALARDDDEALIDRRALMARRVASEEAMAARLGSCSLFQKTKKLEKPFFFAFGFPPKT